MQPSCTVFFSLENSLNTLHNLFLNTGGLSNIWYFKSQSAFDTISSKHAILKPCRFSIQYIITKPSGFFTNLFFTGSNFMMNEMIDPQFK